MHVGLGGGPKSALGETRAGHSPPSARTDSQTMCTQFGGDPQLSGRGKRRGTGHTRGVPMPPTPKLHSTTTAKLYRGEKSAWRAHVYTILLAPSAEHVYT